MTGDLVTIPARGGKAARARAGQRIRIVNTHGTQVVDAWAFNAGDASEWMSMEASRAWFMKLAAGVGDTFVTSRRRPILTLVEDTSGCAHDTLMAPCDAARYGLLGATGYHDNCRDNLHAALAELGIAIPATPPSLNLFMNIPWTAEGRLAWGEPVSAPGSSAVFRAEMDLVIALSACPQDILPINGRTGRTTEAHFVIEEAAGRAVDGGP
ncbi:MAG TPA: urea carboxylase-associated family protein [Methylomirabilota bacterium]|nr:urea carboxylase-associated family protein [Methylomirabilota bacterium]